MQTPETIPALAFSVIVTAIGMVVIYRSWWKNRTLPTLLYALMITLFSGIAWDLLLDQTFIPFRNWAININGQRLWGSNVLLALFIVFGYLAWYYAVMYSEYNTPPKRAYLMTFLAGAALLGDIEKSNWSALIPLVISVFAFSILIIEIIFYARRVLKVTPDPAQRKTLLFYFSGFAVWVLAGPIGLIPDSLSGLPSWMETMWVLPYGIGLLIVAFVVARNPRVLFISEARPLDYLILDSEGNLIFAHRFEGYPASVDIELLGTAMSGIVSLMKEMLSSAQDIHGIDHGDVKILVEHGIKTTHLLVVSHETTGLRQSLRNLVMEFETNFRETLTADIITVNMFQPFRKRIEVVLK